MLEEIGKLRAIVGKVSSEAICRKLFLLLGDTYETACQRGLLALLRQETLAGGVDRGHRLLPPSIVTTKTEEVTVPEKLCALCGQPILKKPKNDPESGTLEHVPPSQFYPKSIRPELRKPLWTVPSHRRCNAALKSDEEYFLSFYYGLVGHENPEVGAIILDDLRRQTKNPQVRNLIKRILGKCGNVSPGGVLLPPTLVRFEPEIERIERVVFKIAQCLFFKDHGRFLPKENCGYINFFEDPITIPEFFRELIKTKHESVDPRFFFYWHVEIEGCHYYAIAFWSAFVFGMAFRDPDVTADDVRMIDLTT